MAMTFTRLSYWIWETKDGHESTNLALNSSPDLVEPSRPSSHGSHGQSPPYCPVLLLAGATNRWQPICGYSSTRNAQSLDLNPPHISSRSLADALSPRLTSICRVLDEFRKNHEECGDSIIILFENCISNFSDDEQYRNDARFLKSCILYGDVIQDFKKIFEMMEAKGVCQGLSMFFEAYAAFLIARGDLLEANIVYRLSISRNAQPLERLKKMYAIFLKHVEDIIQNANPEPQVGRLVNEG